MSTAEPREGLLLQDRVDNGVAVVTVTGDVDVATSAALRDGLLQVVADENFRGLVVNLAGVSFIDSTGIGVLVGVWRRTKATDGCLALASPSRQAQSVLDATGLTRVLSLYSTDEEAVQACAEPGMPDQLTTPPDSRSPALTCCDPLRRAAARGGAGREALSAPRRARAAAGNARAASARRRASAGKGCPTARR